MKQYTKIKRTIQALRYGYPQQNLDKTLILKCLSDKQFQAKYVNY